MDLREDPLLQPKTFVFTAFLGANAFACAFACAFVAEVLNTIGRSCPNLCVLDVRSCQQVDNKILRDAGGAQRFGAQRVGVRWIDVEGAPEFKLVQRKLLWGKGPLVGNSCEAPILCR